MGPRRGDNLRRASWVLFAAAACLGGAALAPEPGRLAVVAAIALAWSAITVVRRNRRRLRSREAWAYPTVLAHSRTSRRVVVVVSAAVAASLALVTLHLAGGGGRGQKPIVGAPPSVDRSGPVVSPHGQPPVWPRGVTRPPRPTGASPRPTGAPPRRPVGAPPPQPRPAVTVTVTVTGGLPALPVTPPGWPSTPSTPSTPTKPAKPVADLSPGSADPVPPGDSGASLTVLLGVLAAVFAALGGLMQGVGALMQGASARQAAKSGDPDKDDEPFGHYL